MIEVNHKPSTIDPNNYEIVGDSIHELIEECLKRIRSRSKEYYRTELKNDLEKGRKSLIDRHAGMGNYYTVILKDHG